MRGEMEHTSFDDTMIMMCEGTHISVFLMCMLINRQMLVICFWRVILAPRYWSRVKSLLQYG